MALTRLQVHQMQSNAVVTTVTAVSQAAMLALTAQTNDFCIRTDVKKTFVLTGTDPTNLSHWQEVYTIDQANVAITGGSISGVSIDGSATGISFSTSATTIDSFDIATYRSAKYVVTVTRSTDFQVSEVLVLHTGANTFCSTYDTISSAGSAIASFSTDIISGNVALQATGVATGNVAKLHKFYIPI